MPDKIRLQGFNNLTKFTDTAFRVWAEVLAATPHSRLVLKGRGLGEDEVRQRYFARFTAAGLPLDTLSMGMSHDLEAAIAEGATIVRIGTAIFGERNHT